MDDYLPKFKKVIALIKEKYRNEQYLIETLESSRINVISRRELYGLSEGLNDYDLELHVEANTFIRFHKVNKSIRSILFHNIPIFSDFVIHSMKILPDYEKFEVIDSSITPVLTDWEEINLGQTKLLQQLSSSSDSIDLQNIGNTARAILQKLSNIVYVHERHKPEDLKISVAEGKFKNRLTSYIIKELQGESNAELRNFARAAIDTVEKSIDLANTVTHKIGVERTFAEVCVIGTIGAISIIKLVHKQSAPVDGTSSPTK